MAEDLNKPQTEEAIEDDPLTQLRNLLIPPESSELQNKQKELQELKQELASLQKQRPDLEDLKRVLVPLVGEEVKQYLMRSPTTLMQWLHPALTRTIKDNKQEIAETMIPLLPKSKEGMLSSGAWDRLLDGLLREVDDRIEASLQESDERTRKQFERWLRTDLMEYIQAHAEDVVQVILPELVPPLQKQLKRALKPYLEQQQELLETQLQQQLMDWMTQRLQESREELVTLLAPKEQPALPSVEELQPAIAAQVNSQLSEKLSEYVQSQNLPDSSELVKSLQPTLDSLIGQRVEQVQGELLGQIKLPENPDMQQLESILLSRLEGLVQAKIDSRVEALVQEKIETALAQLPPATETPEQRTPEELMEVLTPQIEALIEAKGGTGDGAKAPHVPATLVFKEKVENLRSGGISKVWLAVIAGIVAIAFLPLGWFAYRSVRETGLSRQLTQVLANSPKLSPYRLDAQVRGDEVTLTGQLPDPSLHETVEQVMAENAPDLEVENQVEIIAPPPTPEEIQAEVTRVEATLDQLDGISISAEYDNGEVTVKGTIIQAADATRITQAFTEVPGVQAVTNTVEVQPPEIPIRIYFTVNSAQLPTADIRVKIIPLVTLLKRYPELNLKIAGHISPDQEEENGQTLSRQRAEAVQKVLIQQGIDGKRLQVEAIAYPPADVNPQQPDWLKRAVVFYPQ
ncbi:BON domain-containing protein [Roseofilum sp. BLCC_M91]|uniref:BON domain-containing protein n=1 Tax=Roseofilum halophilum BLCC-M91 TaxID=3022259 RepID=A0ABT7BHK9_9CYAN|nr:BON domain-containing protein [Roseofilum halophilum]MDJ1177981.1 BON domain-containing protein [Roseofilum halophilum BLCC-M91]